VPIVCCRFSFKVTSFEAKKVDFNLYFFILSTVIKKIYSQNV